MTDAFVLDCSVTMSWCFSDEETATTTALLRQLEIGVALVPSLWYLEVANTLSLAGRHRRITDREADAFILNLSALNLQVDDHGSSWALPRMIDLCRRFEVTSYDAAYLDLAMRRGLPLATLDARLREAAGSAGVTVLGL